MTANFTPSARQGYVALNGTYNQAGALVEWKTGSITLATGTTNLIGNFDLFGGPLTPGVTYTFTVIISANGQILESQDFQYTVP